jgi:hypothetical protein
MINIAATKRSLVFRTDYLLILFDMSLFILPFITATYLNILISADCTLGGATLFFSTSSAGCILSLVEQGHVRATSYYMQQTFSKADEVLSTFSFFQYGMCCILFHEFNDASTHTLLFSYGTSCQFHWVC